MQNKLAEIACSYFEQGYNCSESVLRAYLDVFALDPGFGAAASGFGGGLGGRGYTCGALSGVLMALGLHYNRQYAEEKELYATVREKAGAIVDEFSLINSSTFCRDLQPYDLSTMEAREKFHNDPDTMAKCKGYITKSAEILLKNIS